MPAKRFGKTRYNRGHQKVRKMWAPRVRAGTVKCARWHQPILPGEKWDLDHDDDDPARRRYLGPSHRRCTGRRSRT